MHVTTLLKHALTDLSSGFPCLHHSACGVVWQELPLKLTALDAEGELWLFPSVGGRI